MLFSIIPFMLLFTSLISLYKWQQSEKSLTQIVALRQSLVKEAKAIGIEAETMEETEKEAQRIIKEIKEEREMFNQKKGILGTDLEIKEKDPETFLESAQSALTKKRQSIDFSVTVDYDKEKLEEARKQKKEKEERLTKVQEGLQEHQQTIADFSKKAQELQFTDDFSTFELGIEIKNLEALERLVPWLNQFIGQIDNDAEFSRNALEIFRELESKENSKSEELFGKDSQASIIFRDITSGMFEDIYYNSSTREILVKPSSEKNPRRASELSRSEWAQLYTAVRIALGEKLLKGEGGFFIVEEPFIHSDTERLLKEFDLLKNLSKRGWQTLYFTAKDEVKQELPKQMDVDIIELKRL
jgi:hypothetical protein